MAKVNNKTKTASSKTVTKKRRVNKSVTEGRCYISTTFNNTLISFTDSVGNVISQCSSGRLGLKGSKKSTPFAAQTCVEKAGLVAKSMGMVNIEVYVKGPGSGRESAIRCLSADPLNFHVTLIKDITPLAHNGCRPPKRRRV